MEGTVEVIIPGFPQKLKLSKIEKGCPWGIPSLVKNFQYRNLMSDSSTTATSFVSLF